MLNRRELLKSTIGGLLSPIIVPFFPEIPKLPKNDDKDTKDIKVIHFKENTSLGIALRKFVHKISLQEILDWMSVCKQYGPADNMYWIGFTNNNYNLITIKPNKNGDIFPPTYNPKCHHSIVSLDEHRIYLAYKGYGQNIDKMYSDNNKERSL